MSDVDRPMSFGVDPDGYRGGSRFAGRESALNVNSRGPMRPRRRGVLAWCAVIGSVVFAGFLGMFSLDTPVLSLDFIMHNVPTMLILVGAGLGWWRSWAGAAWLGLVGVVGFIFLHNWQHWTWPLFINTPPLALAALFTLDAWRRR